MLCVPTLRRSVQGQAAPTALATRSRCRFAKSAILAVAAASFAGGCAPSEIKLPPYDPIVHTPPANATREAIVGSISYDYDGSNRMWALIDNGTLMTWLDSSQVLSDPHDLLDGELEVEGKRFAFQAITTRHHTPTNPDSATSLVVISWAWSDESGHVVERGTATPGGSGTGSFAFVHFLTPSDRRAHGADIDPTGTRGIDVDRCVIPRDGAVTGQPWSLFALIAGPTCGGTHENSLSAGVFPPSQ